jgi:AcrR family transcriptional regulator
VATTPNTSAAKTRALKDKPVPRKRVPAEERREQILAAAAEVVARDGMHAASTAEIARLSGISHAYLFRLFPTKEELVIAVAVTNSRTMHSAMAHAGEAAKAHGEDPLAAMAQTYQELLRDRVQLQVMLQSISASAGMPALGDRMREEWESIVVDIERISGAGPDDARAFLAQGMLLLVISGLGAEESAWATRLHHGPLPCAPGQIDLGHPSPVADAAKP